MRDIQVTRKATHAIFLGIKFFLAKKQYYLTMARVNPDMYQNCAFVKSLRSKPEDYQSPLVPSPVHKKRFGEDSQISHSHL